MEPDFLAYLNANSRKGTQNPYAAGQKIYGNGSTTATSGPVNKAGYMQRDREAAERRNALLRRLQYQQGDKEMSPETLYPLQMLLGR